MRHAQAEPQERGTDHGRRLTANGRLEARATARHLAARGWVPTRILSSDSQRTRETADGLYEVFGAVPATSWLPALYLRGVEAVEEALQNLGVTDTTVMVLGHNPGFSETAGLLCGRPAGLGTGYAALLSTQADSWAEGAAYTGGWTLEALLAP